MPGTRLFVGNLTSAATAEDLRDLFKEFGPIDRIDMKKEGGFGFVEFIRGRDGEEALVKAAQSVNGKELHGVTLTVEEAKGPKREGPRPQMQRSEHRVRVEGMPRGSTWQDLKDFARGSTGLAPLYTEVVRGNPSVGIIEYHRREDMIEALRQINNTELRGVMVQVYEDAPSGRGRGDERRRSYSPPRREPSRGGDIRGGYYDEFRPPLRGPGPRDYHRDRDRLPRSRSRERYPAHHIPPAAYAFGRGRSRSRSPVRSHYPPPLSAPPVAVNHDDLYRRGGGRDGPLSLLPPPPAYHDDYEYRRGGRGERGGRGGGRSRSPPSSRYGDLPPPHYSTSSSYPSQQYAHAPPSVYPEYSSHRQRGGPGEDYSYHAPSPHSRYLAAGDQYINRRSDASSGALGDTGGVSGGFAGGGRGRYEDSRGEGPPPQSSGSSSTLPPPPHGGVYAGTAPPLLPSDPRKGGGSVGGNIRDPRRRDWGQDRRGAGGGAGGGVYR